MIIKSMSRKEPSFSQLLSYMEAGAPEGEQGFTQNLHPGEAYEYVAQFEANAELLSKRKNGVYLYHEILSFKNNDSIPWPEKAEKLREIAEEYLQRRAPTAMAYGAIHDDKAHHTHVHLCISANGVGDAKRIRHSKAAFARLKVDFEKYVLASYPELGQEISIDKARGVGHSPKGGELKRRTGRLSKKEQTVERFRDVLNFSKGKQEFFALLADKKLEIYSRGKTVGFRDTESGRKYRVKTLGLEAEFARLAGRLDLDGSRSDQAYQQARGQVEKVAKNRPPEPSTAPRSRGEQGSSKGRASEERTEPENGSNQAGNPFGTTAEWIKGDFSERDARVAQDHAKQRKEAYREQSKADKVTLNKGVLDEPEKRAGRFGTAREWLAGDFSVREAQGREQASDERLTKWKADRKAEWDKRVEAERQTREGKDERAKQRRERIARSRSQQSKSGPEKDGPDKDR